MRRQCRKNTPLFGVLTLGWGSTLYISTNRTKKSPAGVSPVVSFHAPPATSPSCGQQPLHRPGGSRRSVCVTARWNRRSSRARARPPRIWSMALLVRSGCGPRRTRCSRGPARGAGGRRSGRAARAPRKRPTANQKEIADGGPQRRRSITSKSNSAARLLARPESSAARGAVPPMDKEHGRASLKSFTLPPKRAAQRLRWRATGTLLGETTPVGWRSPGGRGGGCRHSPRGRPRRRRPGR